MGGGGSGLSYRVETVPLRQKTDAHRAIHPFEQVPILKDASIALFESGAILWYLGEKSEALMPRDPAGRAETMHWAAADTREVAAG